MNIIKSTIIPLPIDNVDTDQIIPARFLKATSRDGFGDNLFRDWRYDRVTGEPNSDFVLNQGIYKGQILIAGKNFGCGSSREHAAWALADFGVNVVVSSFFADIFKSNALNCNILPIQVSDDILAFIFKALKTETDLEAIVDLPKQTFSIPNIDVKVDFEIGEYKKICLMNGYDDIDYIQTMTSDIESFETKRNFIF